MLLLPFLVVIIAQPEYYSWYKASLINFDFEFPGADSVHLISCLIFVQAWWSSRIETKPISGRI